MNKLKRSEKFCPECKCKSPIRTFICKQCGYAFPQKDNPNKKSKKEKSKKLNECYLDMKSEKSNLDIKNSFLKRLEEYEKSDGINKKVLTKYIEDNLSRKNINNKNSELLCKLNISDHFELSMNQDEIEINLTDHDPCENYSYDFTKLYLNSNLLGGIAHFSKNLNRVVLSIFEFADRIQENKHNTNNLSMNYSFQLIGSASITIENDEYQINKFSLKFIKSTPILLLTMNNVLSIYIYDKSGNISLLHKILFKEFINAFDCIISADDQIKIVTADYNNTIFLHVLPITDEKINKLSAFDVSLTLIYEKQFSNKITHLAFLPFTEELSQNKQKNFFCASSREGLTKFFDTVNPLCYSFKHKTSELWVSKFSYDKKNNLLYFMTNVGEKIQGIKFFMDETKDPLVKKIPNTENCIYFFKEEVTDRLYFQDRVGNIRYLDSVNINEMFLRYKKKIKYNIQVYDFYTNRSSKVDVDGDVDQSAQKDREELENKSEMVIDSIHNSHEDSDLESKSNSDKTIEIFEENSRNEENEEFYTKFTILAFPNKESKEIKNILILPCFKKIVIKILTKNNK